MLINIIPVLLKLTRYLRRFQGPLIYSHNLQSLNMAFEDTKKRKHIELKIRPPSQHEHVEASTSGETAASQCKAVIWDGSATL